MKISKKRLFGYGFFAAVLAITMYATTVPDASALEICTAINKSAEGDSGSSSGGEGGVSPGGSESGGGASVSGNVEVVVKVYSDNPSIVINQPADGSVLATAVVTIKESYSDLDCLNNTITWGDYKANLGDYVPGSLPAYGDYSTSVNLMALGGYGIYNLKATMATYPYKQQQQENLLADQGYLTDNSGFRYAPVTVTYLGTDENGDPVFQVEYDEFTNYVDLDFLQGGKSVLDGPIRTPVEHPGSTGSMIISIPAGSYGLASGDYTLAATAYGPTADAEVTDTAFDEGTSSITATFDYDEFTDKVYFTVIDANGNVLYLPEAVYTVLNYGTAGTDTIVIDLSGYDLSEYDFSSYTVIAHAYARPGSTENVKELDTDNGPVTIDTKYEKPVAPDVPDTGKILGDLKISTADYWIFGLGVVGVSAAFAYHQMNKRRR